MPDQPEPKAAVRARVRAQRRARSCADRNDLAAALADVALGPGPLADALEACRARGRAPVVALYAATATEPGTGPLTAALAAAGVAVLLPVVAPAARRTTGAAPLPLGWEDGTGRSASMAGATAVLLPALAVDAGGTRLGQGGGHYDVTLAAAGWATPAGDAGGRPLLAGWTDGPPGPSSTAARPLLAAVVHTEEVLAAGSLPHEPHDVGVDAALTPSGWVLLRR